MLREKIRALRAYPQDRRYAVDVGIALGCFVLGAVLGVVAKATDSVSLIGDIGTGLGVWVFVASLLAAYSRYPIAAAVNTLLFFLSMLGAYYLYGFVVLGFFPKAYFLGWLWRRLRPLRDLCCGLPGQRACRGWLFRHCPAQCCLPWGTRPFTREMLCRLLRWCLGLLRRLPF